MSVRLLVLFNVQKYLEAAAEYVAAYEAHEDPLILFNIAQAYRLGGDAQKALGAYRSYLRNAPNPPNRADVMMRIEELQKIVEVQKRSREAPPMGTLGSAPEADPNARETPPPSSERKESKETKPAPTPTANVNAPPPGPQIDVVAERKKARTLTNTGIALAAGGAAFIVIGGALAGVAAGNADRLNNATPGTERHLHVVRQSGAAAAHVGGELELLPGHPQGQVPDGRAGLHPEDLDG